MKQIVNVRNARLAWVLLPAALACAAILAPSRSGSATAGALPAPARLCGTYDGMPVGFARDPHAGMLKIPDGNFELGSNREYPDERPAGRVRVASFWMDRTEVTNAQFASFVAATGYVTQAEREGASAVFRALPPGKKTTHPNEWWHWVRDASWRHPQGPGSGLRGLENEPVVHVTYADAMAYAKWLGHDLPTEAEWEYAASGGGKPELLDREPRDAGGKPLANFWQGVFPDINTREDGYAGLAPAGCFPPNGFGLFDMIGNAWELTRDVYEGPRQPHANGDPAGARADAGAPRSGERLVIKGGSFLCSADYCMRYRAAAREAQEADVAASHVGFRTVLRD